MTYAAAPTTLRFEHRTDRGAVLGIGTTRPRLSWVVPHAGADWRQTAYEVEVDRAGAVSTYLVEGDEQVLVPWPASGLRSRERAVVRVRVACGETWTQWSERAVVEAGLLEAEDWTARFVSPVGIGGLDEAAPVVAGSLVISGRVRWARLHMSAHGVYVGHLNGRPISDTVLAPGWTSYPSRLRQHTYDVTSLIRSGDNQLEVLLGNGWYRGHLGYTGARALYGDRLAVLAQLEVGTDDGVRHVLATGDDWIARESEIVQDDLYDGQVTDLRRASQPRPTYPVEVVAQDLTQLVAAESAPVRRVDVLPAERIWTSPSGRTLVDFGQNAVGWVRLKVRDLPDGAQVVVRHAEVLEEGELATRPLRAARATDTYVLDGRPEALLEPCFTLHGFRYAEVSGVAGLEASDLELVVVASDLPRAGWFTSSNPLLDQFHENVVWGMRGNFVDVPTDCPQRDERLGWTGDIQVFAPTAMFLADAAGFLSSWLRDLAAEQHADGSVPHVVPDVDRTVLSRNPAAAWGDAATVVPWTVYQRSGDRELLARQLPSMRAWVDRIAEMAGADRLWTGGFQYGDWLDPTAPPEAPSRAKTDPDVVATAHLARSAQILAGAAAVCAQDDLAQKYGILAAEVRDAFRAAYVTSTGRVVSDAQTAYAMAVVWDLLPDARAREVAGDRLADLVRAEGFRIATGFVGTPLICDALTATGHMDVAYRLLQQTELPSWLYPVTMGATTVWERWDSMRPDGTVNPGEMTSFNHYALGAVADWMHRAVAGIAPAAPGYRRVQVRPRPGGGLTRASARHHSPYGPLEISWSHESGTLRVRALLPVGVTGEVDLPGHEPFTVGHGTHEWQVELAERPQASACSGDETVRDLMDDAEVWSQVVRAAHETGVVQDGDVYASGRLLSYVDQPASTIADALAPDERFAGAAEFRERIRDILPGVRPGQRTPISPEGAFAAGSGGRWTRRLDVAGEEHR